MNMNKTEIKNKCRQILNSGVASLEGGEDFEFLCDVFKGHDDYESKTKGQRIRMISIKKQPTGQNAFISREKTEQKRIYHSCLV